MPQLILEHSSNIVEKNTLFELFVEINKVLAEKLPTELSSCKSRSIEHNTYCVGNGDKRNAFVHINLKVMHGRSVDKLNSVGKELMEILKKYFHLSAKNLNLQVSLEIDELEKTYFKFNV